MTWRGLQHQATLILKRYRDNGGTDRRLLDDANTRDPRSTPRPETRHHMKPTVGRIVHYQTDGRGGKRYILPAIVTCVFDSHPDRNTPSGEIEHRDGRDYAPGNPVPIPHPAHHIGEAHLHVMTPGGQGSYTEHCVPFHDGPDHAPRTWHWPVMM